MGWGKINQAHAENHVWDPSSSLWEEMIQPVVNVDNLNIRGYVWNTASLSWNAMTQPVVKTDELTVAGSMEVTNFPVTELTLRLDDTSEANIMYLGEAATGSAENTFSWRIKKINMVTGLVTRWANGAATFINKWSEHLTLNYS